jgi:heavy metal sensor kinase
MRNRSIRFRLTGWYSLALTAGLAVFALAIWVSMERSLTSEIDRALAARAKGFGAFVQREMAEGTLTLQEEIQEYAGALPAGSAVQIRGSGGELLLDSKPGFPFRDSVVTAVSWQGHRYRALLLRRARFEIGLAQPMDATESLLTRLQWLLIGCIPPVILAAAAGGNWLSRRALKPVDRITLAARSVGIGNLSERLEVPATGDELQRLAETWNGMLARLEAAVKRLSRFTADASHELRTPLAVIRTTAEIAARRARSPEGYQEALGQIVAESQRMTHLVEDLLFLARCDSESAEMPMTPVDLGAAVEEACCHARPLGEARGITIESRGARVAVSGNGLAIRQLLLVLLDNAIKYSPEGAAVRVAVLEEKAGAVVEIADRGAGIPESDMPHIFERFYRARQNEAGAASGYGLGLSLADAIAQRHGGRIEVTSELGEGSTFRVVFGGVLSI